MLCEIHMILDQQPSPFCHQEAGPGLLIVLIYGLGDGDMESLRRIILVC